MSAVPNDVLKYVRDPQNDDDPEETAEWLGALDGVIAHVGTDRAHFLIQQQIEFARVNGEHLPFSASTPYINTIPTGKQKKIPGDQAIEHTIRSYTRWNAIAIVLRAGKATNVGGHIASFASAATLYDVGFNHFWHAASGDHGGDLVFFQGHSSPGIYSRAFLEGRLTESKTR
jgi:pyruvate dehydrogenase E1 component